ncbi:MAG TPA: type III secretion system translocon subunit SctE [Limnobacter sp.]|uniref:type III secretion system translocon subunit SctE n=1 Tax=Limnobacter sp. TaxID=2003368 RepID=UPI002E2F710E|nr:type III secretion system translocon subunit SctE [Limnobacter sp.]HEX5487443.1 type III secretion system translocon subunit SctE [Limnobacter sp.]
MTVAQTSAYSLQINPHDIQNHPDKIYELLAEYFTESLKLVQDSLKSYIDTLSKSQKNRAEAIKKQVDEFVKQLEKARKMSGLAKFFKALGALGAALAIITAVLIPTPMTIAIAVVSVAMLLDQAISAATGQDKSLMDKAMGKLMEGLTELTGSPIAAAILAGVFLLVLVLACTTAAAKGIGSLGSAIASSTSRAAEATSSLMNSFKSLFSTSLTTEQEANVLFFLEILQSTIMLAQAGVGVDMAVIQFQAAKLMRDYDIDKALIEAMNQIISMLTNDSQDMAELRKLLQEMMQTVLGPNTQTA